MSDAPWKVPHEANTVRELADLSTPEAELLRATADPRRRAALMALRTQGDLPLSDLATLVAAREKAIAPSEVTSSQRDTVLTTLHHNHVPKLTETGLVVCERDGAEPVVRPTMLVREGTAVDVFETAFSDGLSGEAITTLLEDPIREYVVLLLRESDSPFALADLAREVAAMGSADDQVASEEAVSSTTVSLHHIHLPKLADVGLVEYDAADRLVELGYIPSAYDTVIDRESGGNGTETVVSNHSS